MVVNIFSEAGTQYIPESDSDDEDSEVQPKHLDFSEPDIFSKKAKNIADMATQAYSDSDSDATTDGGNFIFTSFDVLFMYL